MVEAAYAIYADDVVFQRIPFPPAVGKAANMEADAGMLAAFSNIRTTVDEIIVEGDAAAIRWTWEGTHSDGETPLGVPATGKQVRFVGCSV
jgi:predicted ester cyclase